MPPNSSAPPKQDKENVPPNKQGNCNQNTTNTTYGKGATMPVLAADKYAEINLPDLPWWELSLIHI